MEYKDYNDQFIGMLVDKKLKNKKYDIFFFILIKEMILRKKYELNMEDDLVEEEIDNIARNIDEIKFVELKSKRKMGAFSPGKKELVINKKFFERELLKRKNSLEDTSLKLFSTIFHEIQHAAKLCEDGSMGIYGRNYKDKRPGNPR